MDAIVQEFEEQLRIDPCMTKMPNKRQIVEQAKSWILDAHAAVTAQLNAMAQEQVAHVEAGLERYEQEYEQMTERDGDHVASAHGLVAHAKALDYVDEWLPGSFLIYLCRRRACLAFARNIHWITTDAAAVAAIMRGQPVQESGYQFRCARCGEKYNKFQERSENLVGATHIMTFNSPSGQPRMMLLAAPSDAEEGLLNSMKEATLTVPQEVANMTRDEQLKELFSLMHTRSVPLFFQPQVLQEHIKTKIDGINRVSTKREWLYQHLLDGYEGNSLKDPAVKQLFAFDLDVPGAEDAVVVSPIVMRKFCALLTSQQKVVSGLKALTV